MLYRKLSQLSVSLTLDAHVDDSRQARANAIVGLAQVIAFVGLLDVYNLQRAVIRHPHVGVTHSKVAVVAGCGSWRRGDD